MNVDREFLERVSSLLNSIDQQMGIDREEWAAVRDGLRVILAPQRTGTASRNDGCVVPWRDTAEDTEEL